jgi:hypothetical protein
MTPIIRGNFSSGVVNLFLPSHAFRKSVRDGSEYWTAEEGVELDSKHLDSMSNSLNSKGV